MNAVEQLQQTIKEALANAVAKAELVEEGTEFKIHLETPKDKANGDFATNIAMQLTKLAKKPPRAIAEAIIENIDLAAANIEKLILQDQGLLILQCVKTF